MNKIFFLTNNKNKIREIKNLLKDISLNVLTPSDIQLKHEPKEIGKTFEENAKIKSTYGFNKSNLPCFADDSGICIEAFNWKPNVLSKNFIESYKNKNECFKHIINKVLKKNKHKAYFQTSICYTLEKDYHIIFNGRVDGRISDRVCGKNGFGYDPIFIPENYNKTFGELSINQKNKISHRSIAITKFVNFISG